MSTLTPIAPAPGRASAGRPALRGLTWLVWREHRASFRLWIFCSAVLTGYLLYWHVRYHATFADDTAGGSGSLGLPPDVGLSIAAFLLFTAPILASVAFGAPLFEREFTGGTFKLACGQSASSAAWVRAKLAVPAAMVILCVTPCAAALTWDFRVDFSLQQDWHGIGVFDAIGPAAVGCSLLGLFLGAASGLAWRRSGPAKVLALALSIAFKAGLFWLLAHLLAPMSVADGPQRQVPLNAWVLAAQSGSGSTSYLPYSDLQPLQWITTGFCVVACAALALLCLRLIRRPQ